MVQNKYDDVMTRLAWREIPGHISVTEEDIRTVEKDLGYKLPPDYREFLLNFGLTAARRLTYPNPQNPQTPGGGVEGFLGINREIARDVRRSKAALGARMPTNVMPIAGSPGGYICLCLDGPNVGTVYWWDRAEDSPDPWKNLYEIAKDFDTFIRSLRIETR